MRRAGTVAAECVLGVFEALGCGVFLLSRRRSVLAHNRVAVRCFGDGLTLIGGRLAATDNQSNAQLQSLIGTVLKSADRLGESGSMGVRRDFKLPLVVQIRTLVENVQPTLSSARLLLVTSDPELALAPPPNMLTDIFRLTPAEANVAVGIAAGRNLAEIAADRGVKVDTVRAHSKMVFSKTRMRGQTELAALLTRFAAWSFVVAGMTHAVRRHDSPLLAFGRASSERQDWVVAAREPLGLNLRTQASSP
jgi:DNA-binding CsgD family transcriptional regulator